MPGPATGPSEAYGCLHGVAAVGVGRGPQYPEGLLEAFSDQAALRARCIPPPARRFVRLPFVITEGFAVVALRVVRDVSVSWLSRCPACPPVPACPACPGCPGSPAAVVRETPSGLSWVSTVGIIVLWILSLVGVHRLSRRGDLQPIIDDGGPALVVHSLRRRAGALASEASTRQGVLGD